MLVSRASWWLEVLYSLVQDIEAMGLLRAISKLHKLK